VETTERYLGSRQGIVHAVNDKLGIEPDAGAIDAPLVADSHHAPDAPMAIYSPHRFLRSAPVRNVGAPQSRGSCRDQGPSPVVLTHVSR
jgi:hypothetical protein